ncbi:fructose-1,6-bisphosphatase I [Campylobacter subantarcticus LMG 24377]|uniref:Fructose-1,6-bisphosphatase class 1 n=1 Tax=Campylobacter subantarcticus TaxID=497724 RepID=A0ABW9N637_9BACT|nr:class 1 fructose-bisphosphatase [Campylobacter subantarcticus]AJC92379.1 fructose-1,6-bisphosphatase I [Campylobacter subantarcticus LMG 24377]EAL3938602.1 class 1 fructose-bisphosphatase [Campylobacter lari]MPB99562.1 class 1 fructose-bisphosphatase [Campylobacter subantarcticus]
MQEIINDIQKAVIEISHELRYLKDFDYTSSQNATGDNQLKLDVKSDEIITRVLKQSKGIKSLISEEKQEQLLINENEKYIIAYDPLDGSSLVDVNFAIGSIFAIYEQEASAKNLKAAVYAIYGVRLELIVCMDTPKLYRLNENNEFVYVKELKLSEKGKLNASGGTQKNWSSTHRDFIKTLFDEGYRLRYSGAMVSDLHQILLKGGGLFSYPATTDALNGKLRAYFEVFPFAFIFEKAGGFSTNGVNDSLLELEFDKIHASTPCFLGSKYEIEKLKQAYKGL